MTATATFKDTNEVCVCGSTTYFYSEVDIAGFFCTECGKPDDITQRTIDAEEGGQW
jgi:hypothetical protein